MRTDSVAIVITALPFVQSRFRELSKIIRKSWRVYESGRRCAEVDAEGVIGKTDRGKEHRLYRNFILRSLVRRVPR